ncbi:MAG: tetratricopeptide repeat protein, partial [Planctomycetota bacterium]
YRAALDLNPGEPIALHQLAVMERKRNALDAAEALLRRALASPQIQAAERTAVREELGRVLERRGEPEAACQQYEELRRENPASRLALRRLLALARAAGDWGRVAGLVRTGKRFGPDTPLLSMYQGMLARRAGDWRAAVRAFERSLPELPTTLDEAHGWFAYAESLRALHAENLGQIVQACLKRLELSPELRREFEALLRRR